MLWSQSDSDLVLLVAVSRWKVAWDRGSHVHEARRVCALSPRDFCFVARGSWRTCRAHAYFIFIRVLWDTAHVRRETSHESCTWQKVLTPRTSPQSTSLLLSVTWRAFKPWMVALIVLEFTLPKDKLINNPSLNIHWKYYKSLWTSCCTFCKISLS